MRLGHVENLTAPVASRPMRRVLASLTALVAVAGCGSSGSANVPAAGVTVPEHPPIRFDPSRAFAGLKAEVAIGPRPAGSAADTRDARSIARRLRTAGVQDVRIQRPYLNVVGEIPGTKPGSIVVGAHHDTKDIPRFVGANDGASGVAVVLGVARALAPHWRGPTLEFALFDAEESTGTGDSVRAFLRSGDRGSRQYVAYAQSGEQGSPELASIHAMVLFDLVGDCNLKLPREETSDQGLYDLFARASPGGPFSGTSMGVLDDHTPFEKAGIQSVDLIDFAYGPGPPPGAYFHSRADNLHHVCRSSLDTVGAAAVKAIPKIR
jgi:glutaminyl-peptide cyclotransferase